MQRTVVGGTGTRLSYFGPPSNREQWALLPHITYVPSTGQYLTVFYAEDDAPPLVESEFEIYMLQIPNRRVFWDGLELGTTERRVTAD
jgi:hypothetical protein